jgi:hypothetical protein
MRHKALATAVTSMCALPLVALFASCDQTGPAPTGPRSVEAVARAGEDGGPAAPGTGIWILHIDGGRFRDHVQIVSVQQSTWRPSVYFMRALPSLDYSGTPTRDFSSVIARGVRQGPVMRWQLTLPGGDLAQLQYQLLGDTASGVMRMMGDTPRPTYAVVGVRVDSGIIASTETRPIPAVPRDLTPEILLRVDDAAAADVDFEGRIRARGLIAEFAIPTRLVGRPGYATWSDVDAWRRDGMGIISHSRTHGYGDLGDADFIGEVIGGMADLAARGFATRIFAQPGTWRGAALLDSPAKLGGWRGALLRSTTVVSEAYSYGGMLSLPLRDSLAIGYSHWTLSDGQTPEGILRQWGYSSRPGMFTTFLVHSGRMGGPAALDWFLDTLAAARAQGRIQLVHTSREAFFGP